jgi:hypothetical protein
VEATPDSHGRFWVTPSSAEKLLPRIESGGHRADPHLLEALRSMLSGESPPEPEQP